MKPTSTPFLLLLGFAALLASCSNKAKVPVPADAALVIHIDGASLHSKLSWDEFKQGELYKAAYATVKDELGRKILNNPDSSGVDIKSDAYMFMKIRGNGGYVGITCAIKDAKLFAALVKEISRKEAEKEGSLYVLREEDMVLTWNDDRLVGIADSPDINPGSSFGAGGRGNRGFPEDSLLKFAQEIYDLKKSQSASSNDKFADMMKEPGDAHYWVNSGKFYGSTLPAVIGLTKLGSLIDGNFTASTLNFENGKISIEAKSYLNKELDALYKKYSDSKIDENMLKKVSGNVLGVLAISYPPEALKEFLSMMGVDGLANVYLSEMGYSIDDLIKAYKGDLLLAASDFTYADKEVKLGEGDDPVIFNRKVPNVNILFATSVNDNASFEKLIALVKEKFLKEAPSSVGELTDKVTYQLKDNWFVAGNDSTAIHSFGSTSNNHAFISKISGHPMGGFIDLQQLIRAIKAPLDSASMGGYIADESLSIWQDAVFYGGEYKDGAVTSHFEVNMVDKNTNSLKQLNQYLGRMAKTVKEREDKMRSEWESRMSVPDTTVSAVPQIN